MVRKRWVSLFCQITHNHIIIMTTTVNNNVNLTFHMGKKRYPNAKTYVFSNE